MITSRLLRLAVFAAAIVALHAQDLPRLRDSESPDHRYDWRLSDKDGKLRYKIRVNEGGKLFGEVPSAYEPVRASLPYMPELQRLTRVRWSPDSHFVVLREPDNSSVQSGLLLVSVEGEEVKIIPVDIEKMKALSPRRHATWSIEFGDWLGNRAFLVRLYGMTFHTDRANEHDQIPVICRIRKGGEITMLNADE